MTVEAQVAESINVLSSQIYSGGIVTGALLYALFAIKHFVCDFPLQAFPYMYKNKGDYGHLGGLLHASVHAVGTFVVIIGALFWLRGFDQFKYTFNIALTLALADMIIHYHIDWAKMRLNKAMGWTPTNSEKFWVLMGFDQLLHNLTYVGFIVYFFSF